MREVEIILVLLAVITALAQLTDKIRIPYPILLVVAGMAISLVPGLPHVELDPEVVFILFLPPLLYQAAWTTSWPDFKAARRPIILLAIGCVLFSTIAVAAVAHYFIPGFPWPVAFVLGAIISPLMRLPLPQPPEALGCPGGSLPCWKGRAWSMTPPA